MPLVSVSHCFLWKQTKQSPSLKEVQLNRRSMVPCRLHKGKRIKRSHAARGGGYGCDTLPAHSRAPAFGTLCPPSTRIPARKICCKGPLSVVRVSHSRRSGWKDSTKTNPLPAPGDLPAAGPAAWSHLRSTRSGQEPGPAGKNTPGRKISLNGDGKLEVEWGENDNLVKDGGLRRSGQSNPAFPQWPLTASS